MVTQVDPAQFAPVQRDVFWRALLAEEDSAKRDAREERTLSVASQARSEARRANNIAIIAMILAATAIISSAFISKYI